jgi:hypothetical protein
MPRTLRPTRSGPTSIWRWRGVSPTGWPRSALDKIRGGIFDLVERQPHGGMPTQFAWLPAKVFWQQEQGILAYLILHGATANDQKYLQLARESMAFWNLFFLDRERQGYFARTTENGLPVIEGPYGQKGAHDQGYHAFELAYLAHVYTRYVRRRRRRQ